MDGVLIDTADAVHDAYTDWANSNDLDPDEVLEIVHGRRTVEVAAHFGLDDDVEGEADLIEKAIANVLDKGLRTPDIMQSGMTKVGTSEMGAAIEKELQALVA